MHLDGLLYRAEIPGDLLVQPSGDDMTKYLGLTWGQRVKAAPDSRQFCQSQPVDLVLCDRAANHVKQYDVIHRLGEKLDRAALHRLNGGRDITLTGEEYDGWRHRFASKRLLQIEPALPWHRNVQDKAAGSVRVKAA